MIFRIIIRMIAINQIIIRMIVINQRYAFHTREKKIGTFPVIFNLTKTSVSPQRVGKFLVHLRLNLSLAPRSILPLATFLSLGACRLGWNQIVGWERFSDTHVGCIWCAFSFFQDWECFDVVIKVFQILMWCKDNNCAAAILIRSPKKVREGSSVWIWTKEYLIWC